MVPLLGGAALLVLRETLIGVDVLRLALWIWAEKLCQRLLPLGHAGVVMLGSGDTLWRDWEVVEALSWLDEVVKELLGLDLLMLAATEGVEILPLRSEWVGWERRMGGRRQLLDLSLLGAKGWLGLLDHLGDLLVLLQFELTLLADGVAWCLEGAVLGRHGRSWLDHVWLLLGQGLLSSLRGLDLVSGRLLALSLGHPRLVVVEQDSLSLALGWRKKG